MIITLLTITGAVIASMTVAAIVFWRKIRVFMMNFIAPNVLKLFPKKIADLFIEIFHGLDSIESNLYLGWKQLKEKFEEKVLGMATRIDKEKRTLSGGVAVEPETNVVKIIKFRAGIPNNTGNWDEISGNNSNATTVEFDGKKAIEAAIDEKIEQELLH